MTIFSTLVPTFLHLSISAFSLVALIPRGAKDWVWRNMLNGDDLEEFRLWLATLGLSLMTTFSIAAPILLIWGTGQLLVLFYEDIGLLYLDLFEWFARGIGAAVEPGLPIRAT